MPAKPSLAPMDYIEGLYAENQPALAFQCKTEAEWKDWRRKLKTRFSQLLGGLDEPRCDLAPVVSKRRKMNGYTRERVVPEPTGPDCPGVGPDPRGGQGADAHHGLRRRPRPRQG